MGWTKEEIENHAKDVLALFEDGFQLSDLISLVPKVMSVAASVEGLAGADKKRLAILLGEYVIDETDTPWVPDAVTDPIMKKMLPTVIQFAWDCYKGKFEFELPELPTGA